MHDHGVKAYDIIMDISTCEVSCIPGIYTSFTGNVAFIRILLAWWPWISWLHFP